RDSPGAQEGTVAPDPDPIRRSGRGAAGLRHSVRCRRSGRSSRTRRAARTAPRRAVCRPGSGDQDSGSPRVLSRRTRRHGRPRDPLDRQNDRPPWSRRRPEARDMITVPAGFRDSALATFGTAGAEFCKTLPAVVDEYAARWSLTLDLPAGAEPWYGMCGIVVPVRTPAGEAAVLKISWADEETEHEHTALAAWSGNGAVRLLAADGARRVLLLE